MTNYVLIGLTKRRAEIAGQIEVTHDALRKPVIDLENLNAIIRQFAPDFQNALAVMQGRFVRSLAGGLVAFGLISSAYAQQGTAANTFKAGDIAAVCAAAPHATGVQKDEENLLCNGFMQGLTQGMFAMSIAQEQGTKICFPGSASLSADEAKAILAQTLQNHPEMLSGSAGTITSVAIMQRYKCRSR